MIYWCYIDYIFVFIRRCIEMLKLFNDQTENWRLGCLLFTYIFFYHCHRPNRSLFFGDFGDPDTDSKDYDEIVNFKTLTTSMDAYLAEYNQVSKAPMSLVMFKFAIEHISRVSRVLKQDNGHLLLIGKNLNQQKRCNQRCWKPGPALGTIISMCLPPLLHFNTHANEKYIIHHPIVSHAVTLLLKSLHNHTPSEHGDGGVFMFYLGT